VVPEDSVRWTKNKLTKGFSVAEVTRSLAKAGYTEEQIDEIFARVTGTWKETKKAMPQVPGKAETPQQEESKGPNKKMLLAVGAAVLLILLAVVIATGFFVYDMFLKPKPREVSTPYLDDLASGGIEKCSGLEHEVLKKACVVGVVSKRNSEKHCVEIPAEWELSFFSSEQGKTVTVNLRGKCIDTNAFSDVGGPAFLEEVEYLVQDISENE
jgi:hypothetical protein